jgi:acetyl-CoA carboxylase alpha subunit
LKSEYGGISYQISKALSDQFDLTVPIISVNIGLCGSGGGLPFVNTADYSVAFENSLKLVSNMVVQTSIMTGISNATEKQREDILKQLVDATAESQKKYQCTDEIIKETTIETTTKRLRHIIIDNLQKLSRLDDKKLISRRMTRIERVINNIV